MTTLDPFLDDLADRLADRLVPKLQAALAPPQHPAGLSIAEAALYVGVSKRQIEEMVRAGDIEPVRIGRRVLIPRHRLDALLGAA